MNQLEKAIIEKVGHDFGFEYLVSESDYVVTLGSARHLIHACISSVQGMYQALFVNAKPNFIQELARDFKADDKGFLCESDNELACLLKRASQLATSLPNQAFNNYEHELELNLANLPDLLRGTEVESIVRQRIGQNTYRQAMLDYWGNACAVTGLQMPEILRASHAKPWSKCETDAERLDVYNGFLLTANLDALFDRFLISFDDSGDIVISDSISKHQREQLRLDKDMKLRWISPNHLSYLSYHRLNLIS